MSNASTLFRSLIAYGICLPLAVTLGYLLADPLDLTTVTVVGIILFILMIPFFLRWHHAWLIAAWNTSAVLFFLPGRPNVWAGMAALSFCIGLLQYTINRNMKFLRVPSVARPLLFFAAVVLITMRLTGGIGLKAFGSSVIGGKGYISIFAAIIGYFALISRQIPPKRAGLYVSLFFLGTATWAIGDLPVVLPSGFNFLYLVFPLLNSGALAQQGVSVAGPVRITGLGFFSLGLFAVMLARYGIRGVFFEPAKLWRAIAFVFIVLSGLAGGFRSTVILCAMTFAVLFYVERLHHTRMLPAMIIAALLGGTLVVAFANRLPFAMQRSLAFLPVDIDPLARMNAATSTAWRLQMWKDLLPQVPQYLILGKGYGFSAMEMAMLQDNPRGSETGLEGTVMAGDYHNGGLSVIIPFGILGMVGFLWFLWAGLRVLYQNYKFGDPAYPHANAFLFAYFAVKIIFFFTIFGGLTADLVTFTGLVGLSVSLNGGVAKPAVIPVPKIVFNRFRLHPSVRRPVGV
jgi:hypothetical protein